MRFRHWLNETNTTALFSYGKDFQVDAVRSKWDHHKGTLRSWDVEDFADEDGGDEHDPEEKKKLKPWEVENALNADRRRNDIIRWAKAGFNGHPEVITDKSLPLTPDWQSLKR